MPGTHTQGPNGRIKTFLTAEVAGSGDVEFFRKTVTLPRASAAVPVEIISDAQVGPNRRVYVMLWYMHVDGATGWTSATDQFVYLIGNGVDVGGSTTGDATWFVRHRHDGFGAQAIQTLGSGNSIIGKPLIAGGGTPEGRGLRVFSSTNPAAGSDVKVTVQGFIA